MPKVSRIEKEKRIVKFMIELYCHKKEGNKVLCNSCVELFNYVVARLDHCKWGEKKPSCRRCSTHCYSPDMRSKIRAVMRFSGLRMLLYRPLEAIKHF